MGERAAPHLKLSPPSADKTAVGTCAASDAFAEDVSARLLALVEDFGREPGKARILIRDLASRDREAFYAATLGILKNPEDTRGYRHLVSVLMGRDLLLRALCDRALGRAQAVALLRAALRIDSMADVNLANALASSAAENATAANDVARLMEIIAEASGNSRIPPALRHMVRHSDPYLRSKAVLMIGRETRSTAWLQNRLAEADPRIRANAVESLWGVDSGEARELLRTASQDPNNRVAGNAVLALYRLGEASAVAQTARMAGHVSPLFRASAAWVMGEAGDPRFAEMLARMLGDPSDVVRKRAMSALQRIKAARSRHTREWQVAAWLESGDETPRRLEVAVADEEGRQPVILPTQIALSEGGQAVTDYAVQLRRAPDTLSVAFVFPEATGSGAPFNSAGRELLAWKRPLDSWWAVPYLVEDAQGGTRVSLDDAAAPVATGKEDARNLFDESLERVYFPDVWSAVERALEPRSGPPGDRRLVVFAGHRAGPPPDLDSLAASAAACRASIHAVSLQESAPLEELCRLTGGTFGLVHTEGEVQPLVQRAYLRLLARYSVTYSPVLTADSIKVRVHTSTAWAECQAPQIKLL